MNKLITNLSCILQELPGIEFLLLVGLERNSSKNKIDLLMGCDEGRIEKYSSLIESLLRDQWPNGNFFVCDDSVRFELPTGIGGVAVCDTTLLVQVQDWVKGKNLGGQRRSWATGYWIPEALCGDLVTAKTLYDEKGISDQLRELLMPYPTSLSEHIIELCTEEIKQKLSILEKLHENAIIERELCLSDIATSMIRIAFAHSRKYLRGFRSLEQQAKLLRSSDLLIYKLALKLYTRKRVKNVVSEIKKLF